MTTSIMIIALIRNIMLIPETSNGVADVQGSKNADILCYRADVSLDRYPTSGIAVERKRI